MSENEYPQLNAAEVAGTVVTLKINMGDVKIKLFDELAPKAVENFITLAKKGYYNGTIFHRVINDFMIQGGDPTGTGMGGQSIWGDSFEDEFDNHLFNFRGALSMANAGPNTNGSQFFIVQNKNIANDLREQMKRAGYPNEVISFYENGGTPWLDHRHTVFGQVIEGMDVVDSIANVKVGLADKPIEDVVIEDISVK